MKKMFKNGLSLAELLTVSAVIAIIMIPTIDFMSTMFINQADFNTNIHSVQTKLDLTERISSAIREAAYVYPDGTFLTLPAMASSVIKLVGYSTVAVLVPTFNANNTVIQPSSNTTRFEAVAYSLMSENSWSGNNTGKYVLIEARCQNIDLAVSSGDNLAITGTPPTDWSNCSPNKLGTNFKPAILQTMGTNAFNIDGNMVTFGFVPKAQAIYFPSIWGSLTLDDRPYITSITAKNAR